MCAISGVDVALWDIAGKALGVPIFKLLGGPVRAQVRAWHSDRTVSATRPRDGPKLKSGMNPAVRAVHVYPVRAVVQRFADLLAESADVGGED